MATNDHAAGDDGNGDDARRMRPLGACGHVRTATTASAA